MEFTANEIKDELSRLGYLDVSDDRLAEFQRDLYKLIQHERSKGSSVNTSLSSQSKEGAAVRSEQGLQEEAHQNVNNSGRTFHPSNQISEGRGDKENGYGAELRRLYGREPGAVGPPFRENYSTNESNTETSAARDYPDDVSDTGSDRRMVKRKILRRNNSGSRFIDESLTESDAGSIIDANERLQRLALRDFDNIPSSSSRSRSTEVEPPYRLSPDDPRPSSVILRTSEHPHYKNLRKSDPVARYHQFKQVWETQRAPGEKQHKGLRWNVREQMLAQENLSKKPQRVFVPNDYVVPSEKQRKALRWQIRMDLAQGNMPPCGFFHEY